MGSRPDSQVSTATAKAASAMAAHWAGLSLSRSSTAPTKTEKSGLM